MGSWFSPPKLVGMSKLVEIGHMACPWMCCIPNFSEFKHSSEFWWWIVILPNARNSHFKLWTVGIGTHTSLSPKWYSNGHIRASCSYLSKLTRIHEFAKNNNMVYLEPSSNMPCHHFQPIQGFQWVWVEKYDSLLQMYPWQFLIQNNIMWIINVLVMTFNYKSEAKIVI